MPALPPILAARQPLPTVSDRARSAPAPAVLPWPVTTPADPGPSAAGSSAAELTESAPSDHALARLARGVQDCARALACLADRLDGLEHRLDAVATATTHPVGGGPSSSSSSSPETEPLDVRVRTLEGMAADRLQAVDQRLRRLEILPVAVGRLQQDTARLSELARAKLLDNGAGDLTSVYQELDSVAELVAAHHGAATQSLERVRTLERAVLEMGRHLDRRLTAAELAPRSIEP
jgi:hypothetical protein